MEKEIMSELKKIKELLEGQEKIFLNNKQVTAEFGLRRSTIFRRVKEGLLSTHRVGRNVFFLRSEIIAMIENGKEPRKERA